MITHIVFYWVLLILYACFYDKVVLYSTPGYIDLIAILSDYYHTSLEAISHIDQFQVDYLGKDFLKASGSIVYEKDLEAFLSGSDWKESSARKRTR